MKPTPSRLLELGFTPFTDRNTGATQYKLGEVRVYVNHDWSNIVVTQPGRKFTEIKTIRELLILLPDTRK